MPRQSSKRCRPSCRLGTLLLALCFACLVNTHVRAASPCAPPSFNTAPVIRFGVASSPGSIVAGDFNRDGRGDLAVTSQTNGGRVAILLGAGDGTFLSPTFVAARDSTFPVLSSIEALVAGDFNGDGSPDLAVSWNADEISVMLGHGDGTFGGPSRLVGGGTGPTALKATDLNGDGKLDLVLSNANSGDVSVLLGTGTGTFGAPQRFPTGNTPDAVAAGDFNGDGKMDLAVSGGRAAILLGDGAGSFGAPSHFETAYSSYTVAAADFDGDGKTDLVFGHVFFDQITVVFGTGTGAFAGRLDIVTGKDARYVSTGDFNRDGRADILVANRESDDVSILTGDGAGHFGNPAAFVAGYGPVEVAHGDFNGDGEADLATVNIFGGTVSILLGQGGGAFAAASSLGGPSTIGLYPVVAGDFNADGKPDVAGVAYALKTVWVMPGDGAGRFGARVSTQSPNQPFFIAAAHFDGDGKLDLVTLERGSGIDGYATVFLANGDGTFRTQTSPPVGASLSRLLVADFNNDGKTDVAVTKNSDAQVAVLLGDGAGGLSAPSNFNVGSSPQELAAADFNNDGKMDLAVSVNAFDSVSLLLGDGAGGFGPALPVAVRNSVSLTAGDFNADGKQDLAVVKNFSNELVILAGIGNGNFEERSRRSIVFLPFAVRTGDYNGDGALDLVVASTSGENAVTLYQGDGAGGFVGPFNFYAGGAPFSTSNADFNGDGKLDLVAGGVTVVPLLNTLGTGTPTVQLCPSNYAVGEGVRSFQVLVSRGGDISGAAAVAYTTQNSTAIDTSDYSAAVGTLHFAPGELSKSFPLFINDDAYAEPVESLLVRLTGATGARLGQPASLFVSITDNETSPGPNPVAPDGFNPLYFVRQHYVDFLNREPDGPGLSFWAGELNSCGADTQCAEVKRVNVSAAFFLSIEFQETGYLAHRTFKAAYGDATSPNVVGTVPVIRLREFLADTQQLGQGVVVNVGDWQRQLEVNKQSYALDFVRRQRFAESYPATMTAEEFVTRLDQNAGLLLPAAERAQLAAALAPAPADAERRAAVLLQVAEHPSLRQREFNRAFVLMQYFGYLRRNPDDAPESDLNFAGWKFWLDKLEQFDGNHVQAEMVKAFITSDEYRKRFGQ